MVWEQSQKSWADTTVQDFINISENYKLRFTSRTELASPQKPAGTFTESQVKPFQENRAAGNPRHYWTRNTYCKGASLRIHTYSSFRIKNAETGSFKKHGFVSRKVITETFRVHRNLYTPTFLKIQGTSSLLAGRDILSMMSLSCFFKAF